MTDLLTNLWDCPPVPARDVAQAIHDEELAAHLAGIPPLPRFDEQTVWATLTPDAQEDLGIAALALAVSLLGAHTAQDDREHRAHAAAVRAIAHRTADLTLSIDPLDDGPYGIPASLGQVCRACGCSDLDACADEGGDPCWWAEEDLCTSCASGGASPAAFAPLYLPVGHQALRRIRAAKDCPGQDCHLGPGDVVAIQAELGLGIWEKRLGLPTTAIARIRAAAGAALAAAAAGEPPCGVILSADEVRSTTPEVAVRHHPQ